MTTLAPFTVVGQRFAPDGRLFIWQKNGVVRVIKQGVLLPTPFIDLSSKVNTFDDRGMWGLAFHPDFASNGYVYMSYPLETRRQPERLRPEDLSGRPCQGRSGEPGRRAGGERNGDPRQHRHRPM